MELINHVAYKKLNARTYPKFLLCIVIFHNQVVFINQLSEQGFV